MQLSAIVVILVALVSSCENRSSLGGTSKKGNVERSPAGSDSPAKVADEDSEQNSDVSKPSQPKETPGEDEFAETPDNVLGAYLTINTLPSEDGGRTAKRGLTMVDVNGQKLAGQFTFTSDLPPSENANQIIVPLTAERGYHAVQVIKARTKSAADSAADNVKISARGAVSGQDVTVSTTGDQAEDVLRGDDDGAVGDVNINPPG